MKKSVKILLPFVCLSVALLSGCKKDNKIMLSFGDMHASDITDVSAGDIEDKVDNKESFMLAVSSNTCVCWSDFHPIIKSYITENHLYCAHISYNDFKDFASNYGIVLTQSTTTFVIFDQGEAKVKVQSSVSDKTLKDLNTFKKFMNSNVKMPKMYLVNEDDVNSIIDSSKKGIVYFERTKCGDCTYINRSLYDYYKNNYNKPNMYVLDCQPWKSLSAEEYQGKKDQYGLSALNNPQYGANIGDTQGVFPYFAYYENGTIASAAVAFNDVVSKVDGKYIVTDSYYTTERVANLDYTSTVIKGMELSVNDVSDNGVRISWDQDSAIKQYKPILTSFLDSKLQNTNY